MGLGIKSGSVLIKSIKLGYLWRLDYALAISELKSSVSFKSVFRFGIRREVQVKEGTGVEYSVEKPNDVIIKLSLKAFKIETNS